MKKYVFYILLLIVLSSLNSYASKFDFNFIHGITPTMNKPQIVKLLKKHHIQYYDSVNIIKFVGNYHYKIFNIQEVEFTFDYELGGALNQLQLKLKDTLQYKDVFNCLSESTSDINVSTDEHLARFYFNNCETIISDGEKIDFLIFLPSEEYQNKVLKKFK